MHEILVEESVIGWKEFELEVMRDVADNFVVICSIENVDPMGVHTGDSITVAPALTLTDKEYQRMRDMARRIIRRVGVETGGSNIQFAVNPADGRIVAIEMNPRVSRSSALASKATGFPIAKIAAKLALGYHLDEIPNDITRLTPASFEPTIDYVVVKFPRWNFEKFPQADRTLTTQMKSVGEAMAIGRTFKEAFLKAVRSLELGKCGRLFAGYRRTMPRIRTRTRRRCASAWSCRTTGGCGRSSARSQRGWTVETHARADQDRSVVPAAVRRHRGAAGDGGARRAPRHVDRPAADAEAQRVRRRRHRGRLRRATKTRCAQRRLDEGLVAGLQAHRHVRGGVRVVHAVHVRHVRRGVRGGSDAEEEGDHPRQRPEPHRAGHRVRLLLLPRGLRFREEGFETVMVNCNPETVSTDYDTADRLYFEPLTFEDVMAIIDRERSARRRGVVRRAVRRPDAAEARAGAAGRGRRHPRHVAGLDRPRRRPAAVLAAAVGSRHAAAGERHGRLARGSARGRGARSDIPVVVRPSYVLGGRGMAIVFRRRRARPLHDAARSTSRTTGRCSSTASSRTPSSSTSMPWPTRRGAVVIGGIMEHIEEAGIHSGDSSCVVPPFMVAERHLGDDSRLHAPHRPRAEGRRPDERSVRHQGRHGLRARGESARVAHGAVSSRRRRACRWRRSRRACWRAARCAELGVVDDLEAAGVFVKSPVFPFVRFPGVDTILGPEMKSTGEVMGGADNFGAAFGKAMMGAGQQLPEGRPRVHQRQQQRQAERCCRLRAIWRRSASRLPPAAAPPRSSARTASTSRSIYKVNEGRPNIADQIVNGKIDLVINTPLGRESFFDDRAVRRAAMMAQVPCITTLTGASAAVSAIRALRSQTLTVRSLQDYYAGVEAGA